MERNRSTRVGVVLVLMLLMIGFFIIRLYGIQVVNGKKDAGSADTYTYTTRVTAARGEILDRNGKVLVTNRASYNLIIISSVLFSSDAPNESLRQLVNICTENGYEIADHLPVTQEKPYEFTLDEYSSDWRGYYRDFLNDCGWDPDISAAQLMKLLREKYNLPDDWSEQELRAVSALRYELSLRYCTTLPTYTLMEDVNSDVLSAIMDLRIPGLNVESSTVREYATPYAAHILGSVGKMNPTEWETYSELDYPMDAYVGKDGLERAFESDLHGTDGTKTTVITADGTTVSEYYSTEPVAGNNIETTINIDLQIAAEQALERTILDLRENGVGINSYGKDAEGGAVVAMDVNTGEILACASYPSYDLATYNQNYNELKEDKLSPLLNRTMNAIYNPGSTFKMVTTIAAINNDVVGRYFGIEDKGVYEYYKEQNFTPYCYYYTSYHQTHGVVDAMQALAVSCNYYFYEIGRLISSTVGWDALDKVSKDLGLGEATGVELPESTGHRANAETKKELYGENEQGWYGADVLMASIGQSENKFTPLQLCCYTSALANGGTRYKATFLSRVVSGDYQKLVRENIPEVLSTCYMSEESFAAVHEGMRMTVTADNGTAHSVFGDYPIAVSAKTGTVQTDLSIAGIRSDSASFVCYAPSDDPQIAVAVYVENGAQGGNLGNIAKAMFDVYFADQSSTERYPAENSLG